MIKTIYRSFEIFYTETAGYEGWSCSVTEKKKYTGGEKLSIVKQKIDKFLKEESEFKNKPGFIKSYGYGPRYNEIEITSIASDHSGIWVKDANQKRQKVSNVLKKSKKNLEIIEKINSELSNIQTANRNISEFEKQLEGYNFSIKET